eukprot:328251-Pelagomonas_calceolata.AAC.8
MAPINNDEELESRWKQEGAFLTHGRPSKEVNRVSACVLHTSHLIVMIRCPHEEAPLVKPNYRT